MKSVSQLRSAGFDVAPSVEATDCTEVRFPSRFFYYNPRFHKDPFEAFAALAEADEAPTGGYRIIIAGVVSAEDGEIPLEVVPRVVRDRLAHYHRRHTQVSKEAARACAQFETEMAQELGM